MSLTSAQTTAGYGLHAELTARPDREIEDPPSLAKKANPSHPRRTVRSSTSRKEETSMASTGQKCGQSGIWQNTCSDRLQIALSKGDTFPPCRNHGSVNWTLIQATRN
jgi:hypothetical protein